MSQRGGLQADSARSASGGANSQRVATGRLAQNDEGAAPADAATSDQADTPKNNPRLARSILRKARENLRDRSSIRADILETVAIGERKFKATGSYIQGTDMRLCLEYQVQVGQEIGSLKEVCDGQVLWTQHIIGPLPGSETNDGEQPAGAESADPQAAPTAEPASEQPAAETPAAEPTAADPSATPAGTNEPAAQPGDASEAAKKNENIRITRRDVEKIRKAGLENPNVPERVLIVELGLGGLPALLASIEDNMQFNTVHEERIDGQAVTVIEGTWTPATFQRLGGNSETNRLPDHIPEKVEIYFDSETLFPRRIKYMKQHPVRAFFRPMLTLDFVNVVLDGPIDEMAFHYEPPEGVIPNDITELYLKQLASGARKFDQVEGEGSEPAAEQPAGETAAPAEQPSQN